MTDLHHHQERFSGVEEIACMVDVTPSGENNRRNVPGAPCRWPRKLRRSMKYLHPEESLQSLIVVLVASVLHRPTKFLRSATCSPGTGQTATRSITTSDFFHATWPFLVVVKVGHFIPASVLCPGEGLRFFLVAFLWYVVSKSSTC